MTSLQAAHHPAVPELGPLTPAAVSLRHFVLTKSLAGRWVHREAGLMQVIGNTGEYVTDEGSRLTIGLRGARAPMSAQQLTELSAALNEWLNAQPVRVPRLPRAEQLLVRGFARRVEWFAAEAQRVRQGLDLRQFSPAKHADGQWVSSERGVKRLLGMQGECLIDDGERVVLEQGGARVALSSEQLGDVSHALTHWLRVHLPPLLDAVDFDVLKQFRDRLHAAPR